VNVDNLSKKLSREFSRNKKKSAILAVMCLVAVYFWAPLVKEWVFGKSPKKPVAKKPAKPETPTAPVLETLAAEAASSPALTAAPDWKQVAQWIETHAAASGDPHAALQQITRDPFQPIAPPKEQHPEEATTETPIAAQMEQAVDHAITAGLQLTSTFVGGRNRVAYISGVAYEEGEHVPLSTVSLTGQALELRVLAIRSGEVVLEHAGRPHILRIERRLSGG